MARGGRGGGNSADTIQGTNGADFLEGFNGSFILAGGKGDDTYVVDDPGDIVDERNNGGTDKVISYIDFVLGENLENLELAGTDDFSGTGNSSDNELIGNLGNNILTGGDGSDLIDGGAGDDTAVFSGLSTDYQVAWNGNDLHLTSPVGDTDVLRDVEFLAFDDGIIAVSDLNDDPGDLPPPVAVDDSANSMEDSEAAINVLVNDLGNGLTIAAATNGGMGLVTINNDGSLTYRPNENAFGTDSFTYTITDELGRQSTAIVTIDIAAANDAPVVVADSYTTTADTTYQATTSVLANDADVDGDPLTVVGAAADANVVIAPGTPYYQTQSATGGSVKINSDGTFSYSPLAGFTGTDTFSYAVTDSSGATGIATVTLEVIADDSVPYYIEEMLAPSPWHRLNYPDEIGTAVTVTFAFADATPHYYDPESFAWDNFQAFTDAQQDATLQVLEGISNFSGLSFVETSIESAEIVFGTANVGFSGFAYFPSGNGVGSTASDVWIDDGWAALDFIPGTFAYAILAHEIGHALGLASSGLPDVEETRQFTATSSIGHQTMNGDIAGYQLYDIAALQYLYGSSAGTSSGADTYTFGDLGDVIKTIWDSGGHDVFDLSGATYGVNVDLAEGAFSTVAESGSNNIAIAFGTTIEDVTGSAFDDHLTGNMVGNQIIGGSGDDLLTGRGGSDIFGFGANWGDDTITDFTRGEDLLDLSSAGLTFSDLSVTAVAGGTMVTFGSDSVVLAGVETIDASDLLLVA